MPGFHCAKFRPPAVVGADAERPADMVEDDVGVREGAGEVGEFEELRVIQPGLEAQVQRGQAREAGAQGRIEPSAPWAVGATP